VVGADGSRAMGDRQRATASATRSDPGQDAADQGSRDRLSRAIAVAVRSVLAHSGLCRRGHPFNAANTRILPNGVRTCRTCQVLRRDPSFPRLHRAGSMALDPEERLQVLERVNHGGESRRAVARDFGVSERTVRRIVGVVARRVMPHDEPRSPFASIIPRLRAIPYEGA
jgi:hypothetical protein